MEELLTYSGIKIDAKRLTVETQEWLTWYNLLSEDMQKCINHQPYDLYKQIKLLPYQIRDAGKKNAYNPGYWNTSPNIKRANCYAYAMDIVCSIQSVKLQPGSYAVNPERFDNTVANNAFINLQADIRQGGFGTVTNVVKVPTPLPLPLPPNQTCVALVVAPLKDYHWYIQHADGLWTHKRGLTEAIDYDAMGAFIDNANLPDACNRTYIDLEGNIIDYSSFIGYYIITH